MPAPGYGMIAGRGQKTALAALAAAEAAGVPVSEVRTEADGYSVPLAVLDAYEAALKKSTEAAEPVKKAAPKKKSDPSDESPSDSNVKH